MTRPLILVAAFALLAQAPPPGVSPEAQYHVGAQAFIEGDQARALDAVRRGLDAAPDDARLRALRDLIEQPQDEQDSDDGGQDRPQDEQEAGGEGEPSGDPQDSSEGDRPDESRKPEAERDGTSTPQPQDAQSGEAPPQPAGRQPDEMTAAQAERILDAVGGEERLLLRELRRAPTQRSRSAKDW